MCFHPDFAHRLGYECGEFIVIDLPHISLDKFPEILQSVQIRGRVWTRQH